VRYLYLLTPKAPGWIRGGSLQGLLPRSDTLSAALVSVWCHVDRSVDMSSVAAFPPFCVSSGLPWISRGASPELLLPMPAHILTRNSRTLPGPTPDYKSLKKVAYVDAAQLARILSGKIPLEGSTLWDMNQLLTSFDGTRHFSRNLTRTRLSVDRLSGGPREGLLFDGAERIFSPGCGWGLLVDLEPSNTSTFSAVLRLLGMEGVGSDRTSGMGQFEVLEGPTPWIAPDLGHGARLLLSLCHPSAEDVARGILHGRYGLVERSGWITAPGARSLRRGRVRMLTEGSWFPDGPAAPGTVVQVQEARPDVGLSHPIFRDGRGLTMAMRVEGADV
jgi:CRISPR type III-A-associated RAMP protein Csm4